MNDDGGAGPTPGGAIAYPLLIECDSRGRVLWMSERTHLALCEPQNLHYLETVEAEGESPSVLLPVSQFQFWRVLEMGDRMLISAQSSEPAASVALREMSEMLHLQAKMLGHYFRLQIAERTIAGHAQQRRWSGPKAVRLIEMERQRIARELHTGVAQMLAAIRLQLEIVTKHISNPPDPVRLGLEHIGELADDALQQVRSVSQRLHPPEWQRLSLAAALQQLWEISGIPQKFEGALRIEAVPAEPHPQVKVVLYRAVQEALSNLIRHSRATRVDAVLALQGDRLVLSVADNGAGFDAVAFQSAPANVASGIGLRSIRELAAGLGGELSIESGPAGTKLVVSVPCYLMEP